MLARHTSGGGERLPPIAPLLPPAWKGTMCTGPRSSDHSPYRPIRRISVPANPQLATLPACDPATVPADCAMSLNAGQLFATRTSILPDDTVPYSEMQKTVSETRWLKHGARRYQRGDGARGTRRTKSAALLPITHDVAIAASRDDRLTAVNERVIVEGGPTHALWTSCTWAVIERARSAGHGLSRD